MTTPAASSPDDFQVALSGLVEEWIEVRARINRLKAQEAELLAAGADLAMEEMATLTGMSAEREIPLRTTVAEFAAAGRMPHRTVEAALFDAQHLVQRLPRTHAALAAGEISEQHVRAIAAGPVPAIAPASAVAEYERRVLERARVETAARTRPLARSLSKKLFPRDSSTDHRAARSLRSVRVVELDDSMADLICTMPAVHAFAIRDRLTRLAKVGGQAGSTADGAVPTNVAPDEDAASVLTLASAADADAGRANEDPRSIDQKRADILTDILLTGDPTLAAETGIEAIRAQVQVTIPVTALVGIDEQGAELAGFGAVDPALIRELAGLAAGWDRLFIDPATETVVRTDRYRPTDSMRRFLRARDQRCRFPGCRASALRCDVDHTTEYCNGGDTSVCNLAHLCRGHHSLKHPDVPDPYRWSVRQREPGVLVWTSPTGRTYVDRPPPRVEFSDAGRSTIPSARETDSESDAAPPWARST